MNQESRATIAVWVDGLPIPKGSVKTFARPGAKFAQITYSNAGRLGAWQGRIVETMRLAGVLPGHPITRAVRVSATFFFPRPASHFGKRKGVSFLRDGSPRFVATKNRNDLDKLLRSVFDALVGPVLEDDGQVVQVNAEKVFVSDPIHPSPGVLIVVHEIVVG